MSANESTSKDERADSVERQLDDDAPPTDPPSRPSGGSEPADGTKEAGESRGRSGQDILHKDGQERGRHDGPDDPETGRPTGTSDSSDQTGVADA